MLAREGEKDKEKDEKFEKVKDYYYYIFFFYCSSAIQKTKQRSTIVSLSKVIFAY